MDVGNPDSYPDGESGRASLKNPKLSTEGKLQLERESVKQSDLGYNQREENMWRGSTENICRTKYGMERSFE